MQEEGESKSSVGERAAHQNPPTLPFPRVWRCLLPPFHTILPGPLFLVPMWPPCFQAGLLGSCLSALPKPPCPSLPDQPLKVVPFSR